jgi:nicotinamidase-related amidase
MTQTQSLGSEEQFFRARGFGQRIGFGRRPALLVIDLTLGFTDSKRPLGSNLDSQVAATNQLIDAAHARTVPVFFTSVRYDSPDMSDAGIWALKQGGAASLLASGDGHVLDPRLARGPNDGMIYKKYASCFFGTDLASRLVNARVDTLLITGTSTSGCVRASAVDACQLGFRPMVVNEGVGDRSAAAHAQSMFDLDAKYADVVALAACLDYLSSI